MDPENKSKDTVVKVTDWLRGIWEMRRQNGPVQQWIDSIPSPIKSSFSIKNEHQRELTEKPSISLLQTEPKDIPCFKGTKQPSMTVSAPINVPSTTSTNNATGLPSSLPHKLMRDPSLQSDSSHCSSVESLLELRKADPEAILLGLGFGGCSNSPQENGSFSRIPKRFLQPSKLKGIAINDFMKQQQETSESFDSVSLGYRGLTGSPYVAPSEIVQKIVQRLREHESHEHDPYSTYNSYEQYSPLQCNGTLSVLSPDNRQFLERPRSKSPDMRNKRMIIGQKSFAFGHDGDLIEIDPSDANRSPRDDSNDSNTIKNSETSDDLQNSDINHCKITETEKVIPKRLLFEDSIEFDNIDIDSSIQTYKENSNTQNTNFDENTDCKEDVSLNVTSYNLSDIRRASSGSCDTKIEKVSLTVQRRRYSDGFVQTTENTNETNLIRKRKTLKRQTRISDTDTTTDYYDSKASIPDTIQHKELECNLHKKTDASEHNESIRIKLTQNINENVNVKAENENENRIIKCSSHIFSEDTSNCIQSDSSSSSLIKRERQQDNNECCVEKNRSVNQEEETTCCCHTGTKKYWKKMEKIIQENKNLESMVAKNRREMREIREMLSSVLSVRLEPGF
ncbi:ki-ras-induced actin-interacting protein-IP3R-interacting domain olf186-M isoform X1 [Osmia lignaria lignaria]|uniref:ki-ras-induced actin-interacting protein-IP3R-interacting domain olf186-M isoform X1 n=2 Tax=Osmia lignaria lignaria TaxID=1437193 RepID=UPI00402BCD46